jgi:hypothetical protein
MKPLHIYTIETEAQKNEHTPSPGAYEPEKSFGKTGVHYTMPVIN